MARVKKEKFSWEETPLCGAPKSSNVGQAVYDILSKPQENIEVGEILDEYKHEYLEEILTCINENKNKYEPPFYIVVLTKKEPWALNVMRNWFIARQTKPSAKWMRDQFPNFMQTVYSWHNKKEELKILWSLPIAQDAAVVLKNKDLYDPQLVKWVQDYDAGNLN